MIDSVLFRWMLTIVLTGAGLWFLLGSARPAPANGGGANGRAGRGEWSAADRISGGAHALLGAAMIAMVWPWGMTTPVWLQVAVFGPATIWFLARAAEPRLRASPRPLSLSALRRVHHALMAAAMLWTAAAMSMAMSGSPLAPAAIVAVSVPLGVYFLLAGFAWLPGVVAPPRHRALDAAGHAAMSLGMSTLILANL